MPLRLNILTQPESVEAAIVDPLETSVPIRLPEFIINDTVDIELYFIEPNSGSTLWSGDSNYTIRIGIGELGGLPENGTFIIKDDTVETNELDIDLTAQDLEDILNGLNSGNGPYNGLVDVSRVSKGNFIIKRRDFGAFPLIEGDGSLLTPDSTVVIDEVIAGSPSSKQMISLRLLRQPYAYSDVWTPINDPETNEPYGYRGTLSLNTVRMMQFLAGKSSAKAWFEVEVTDPQGNIITHSQENVIVRNEVIGNSVSDPANFPAESAKYFLNKSGITTLTGGSINSLDLINTTNRAIGTIVGVEVVSGKIDLYRLESGTDAENLPDVVHPLDYDAINNPRIWRLKEANIKQNTDFIDLGTLTGSGSNLISIAENVRIQTVRAKVIGTAPFTRYIELDINSGQIGDIVFIHIEGNASGSGTADVRMRHNGPYPTHYAMRLRAAASTVHGWFAFIKRENSSQPWYYMGGSESAEYYSDPVFPISPSIPQQWYARLHSHIYELTESSITLTDLNQSNVFSLTLTGDSLLQIPANMRDGHIVLWIIVQDSTGGHNLSFHSSFLNPPTIDTAPDAITFIHGVCRNNKVHCFGASGSSSSPIAIPDGSLRGDATHSEFFEDFSTFSPEGHTGFGYLNAGLDWNWQHQAHPGVVVLALDSIESSYISGNNSVVLGNNQWHLKALFLGLSNYTSTGDAYALKVGFFDQALFNDDAASWRDVAFTYNYNLNQASNNWQCLTKSGNNAANRTLTSTTTPAALTPGSPPSGDFTQQLLEIKYDGDGSQHSGTPTVDFYINGALIASHTTHLPNINEWSGHFAIAATKTTHSGISNKVAFDYLWSKITLPENSRLW